MCSQCFPQQSADRDRQTLKPWFIVNQLLMMRTKLDASCQRNGDEQPDAFGNICSVTHNSVWLKLLGKLVIVLHENQDGWGILFLFEMSFLSLSHLFVSPACRIVRKLPGLGQLSPRNTGIYCRPSPQFATSIHRFKSSICFLNNLKSQHAQRACLSPITFCVHSLIKENTTQQATDNGWSLESNYYHQAI